MRLSVQAFELTLFIVSLFRLHLSCLRRRTCSLLSCSLLCCGSTREIIGSGVNGFGRVRRLDDGEYLGDLIGGEDEEEEEDKA